jgi:peptidyl-prolyl cis-trans isomerase SurA
MIMNNVKFFFAGMAFLLAFQLSAQDDRTLVTIAGEDIEVDEFMYVFKKNNPQGEQPDSKSLEEYLGLFINFKLKVKEAESLGMDTNKAFQGELAGYRQQLAEPYFVNKEILDDLLLEAYERKKYDIRASHILFRVGPNAMPEDSLKAYEKAMNAFNRIQAGEPFVVVAKEVSEDPSVRDRDNPRGGRKIPGNGGDLGYFSVFDMVYPFENGAYNTPVGEVSKPVRSDFGYHLIKVTQRIPTQGTIEAAHLFLQMPDTANAQDSAYLSAEAQALHQRIVNGEDFDVLVREYSDDKGSASRGGLLPQFTVNRMVPEFIEAISKMDEPGSISEPVLTGYGWHIIKLVSKSGLKPFDELKEELQKRLEKDQRAQKSTDVVLKEIKKEYGYTEHPKALQKIFEIADSSLFKGEWKVPEGEKLTKPVFTLGNTDYTQQDFAEYIEKNQTPASGESINEYVNKLFHSYSDEKCRAYEDARLEEKHPEFRAVVREYRDGILLFELTNEKIWSFAGKDTVGLKDFHERHKYDYMWDTRLDVSKVTILDDTIADSVRLMTMDGKTDEEIIETINTDGKELVRIERRKYQKGDNEMIDSIEWKKGVYDNLSEKGRDVILVVHDQIPSEPKTFDEARGLIIAGYQEELEKKWIEELKAKYPVVVHEDVLSTLTNN